MNRDKVIDLFATWKAAGLKPPAAATPKQADAMIDTFMLQYKHITEQEFEALKAKLCHANYWPRFADIDEVLAECRKGKNSNPNYASGLYGKAKRERECETVLGRKLKYGESWVMALANKAAARLFKDASMSFIEQNKLVLATQQKFDFDCATCPGLSHKECPYGCHKPYLKVEQDTGLCVQYVDAEKCPKAS